MDKFKAEARMHGAKFDDDNAGEKTTQQANVDPEVPLFGDPKEYANMSDDEKESLTQKMMGKHKTFVNKKGL